MDTWDEDDEPSDDELSNIEADDHDHDHDHESESGATPDDVAGDDPHWLLYNAEPLLSPEEERALFRRYAAGRAPRGHYGPMTRQACEARERLIVANTRLVRKVANHFIVRGSMTREDLEMEGMFGLIRAVERFDLARGYKLSTMATWWIRQAMGRALDDQPDMIREPVHARQKRRSAARHTGETARPTLHRVLSLDAPVNNDPGNDPLGYFIADESAPLMADTVVDTLDTRQTLYLALGKLTARERYVIELRYGLSNGGEAMTLEQVGRSMEITRERVRQIEAKAMTALRLSLMETAEGDVCLRMLALVKSGRRTSTSGRQVSNEPRLVKQRVYNQRKQATAKTKQTAA